MTDEIKTTKMDIKEAQMCASCGETPLNNIDFYEVTIAQAIVNRNALRQFGGLMLQTGHAALADVFTPDRKIADIMPPKKVHICHECFLMKEHHLAALWSDE